MTEQRRDQSKQDRQQEHKRAGGGAGHHEKKHGAESAADRARQGEKPRTEQASHQGGGQIRTDHLPQGK